MENKYFIATLFYYFKMMHWQFFEKPKPKTENQNQKPKNEKPKSKNQNQKLIQTIITLMFLLL